MATQHLIATNEFCIHHKIEHSFISELSEAGLIQVTVSENTSFITEDDLGTLERMVRLHHELEINVPGIAAITHLLQQVEDIREEMRQLYNRLKLYE